MLSKWVLLLGLAVGGALGFASSSRTAVASRPTVLAPETCAVAKNDSCLPRGSGCTYSHDCCSGICRTIKGTKSCN